MQAPIVEEFAKGLGVFLIFVSARRAFDGPIDGIVYGALVGAGFAFTENIQYFAVSFIEGGVGRCLDDVLRARHPLAVRARDVHERHRLRPRPRRSARRARRPGGRTVGARAWSARSRCTRSGTARRCSSTSSRSTSRCRCRCSSLFVLGVIALRREEARLTRARLGDYAAAGWFTAQEVDMLATSAGRKAALAWARTLRGDRTALMKRFISDATALAAARQRAITGRDPHAPPRTSACCSPARPTARAALFAP